MTVVAVAFALLQTVSPQAVSPDSAESLRRAARDAERRYEFLLRRLVPTRHGSPGGGRCDEYIGRFCLRYDGGDPPDAPPDPPRVVRARQDAVNALRMAFAALPGDLETTGPLLRYLVEDERAEEALSAALAFRWASADSIWGGLLIGFAHHAAGDDSAAVRSFLDALDRMPANERRAFEKIDVLLRGDERGAYEDMDAAARARYEQKLWRLADPLYLLPGNERFAEHIARHVWSRLLSDAPVVSGMTSWGSDLDELTVRYGVPTSRERILGWSPLSGESMVEHYDPEQLTYVPDALATAGFPPTPPPGEDWPLEDERARTGYALKRVRRLAPLAHQISRFPHGDSVVVRIDGLVALDSAAAPDADARAGFFLLRGPAFETYAQTRGAALARNDSVRVAFELTVPPGDYVYSLEILETGTRFAARARYALGVAPATGPTVSDPMIVRPFGDAPPPRGRWGSDIVPHAKLVFLPGDTVGLYAEAHRLTPGPDGATRYQVELAVRSAEDPALLTRAVRWLGRTLGLSREAPEPSLAWQALGDPDSPAILAVDLPLAELEPGLYALDLEVTDLVGSVSHSTTRLFRIREPGDVRDGGSSR